MTNNTGPSLNEAKVRLNRSQRAANLWLMAGLYTFGFTWLCLGFIVASFTYRSDVGVWLATIMLVASAALNGAIIRFYVDAQADYAIQKLQFNQNFPSSD